MTSILFCVRHDSHLALCRLLDPAFRARGWSVSYYLHGLTDELRAQYDRLGLLAGIEWQWGGHAELFEGDRLARYDAVMCSIPGNVLITFVDRYVAHFGNRADRPLLVGGYPGEVISELNPFLDRSALDLLFVNTEEDLQQFRSYARMLGIPATNFAVTGYPFLDPIIASGIEDRGLPERLGRGLSSQTLGDIVFAGQVDRPATGEDRAFVIHAMVEYARRYPERKVYYKPRVPLAETTSHPGKAHEQDLLNRIRTVGAIPANFIFTYEPLFRLFQAADTCLSISSTAGVEALAYGLRPGFIGDFGLYFGVHKFVRSGSIVTLDEVLDDRLWTPDPAWVRATVGAGDAVDRVTQAIESALAQRATHGLPPRPRLHPSGSAAWVRYCDALGIRNPRVPLDPATMPDGLRGLGRTALARGGAAPAEPGGEMVPTAPGRDYSDGVAPDAGPIRFVPGPDGGIRIAVDGGTTFEITVVGRSETAGRAGPPSQLLTNGAGAPADGGAVPDAAFDDWDGSENLLRDWNALASVRWGQRGLAVEAAAARPPEGGTEAFALRPDDRDGLHDLVQEVVLPADGGTVRFSLLVKGVSGHVFLKLANPLEPEHYLIAGFDLAIRSVSSRRRFGQAQLLDAGIVSLRNGWARCYLVGVPAGSGTLLAAAIMVADGAEPRGRPPAAEMVIAAPRVMYRGDVGTVQPLPDIRPLVQSSAAAPGPAMHNGSVAAVKPRLFLIPDQRSLRRLRRLARTPGRFIGDLVRRNFYRY
jgi:hypothetical protein